MLICVNVLLEDVCYHQPKYVTELQMYLLTTKRCSYLEIDIFLQRESYLVILLARVLNEVQKFHRIVHKLFVALSFYVTCVRVGMKTSGWDESLLCQYM